MEQKISSELIQELADEAKKSVNDENFQASVQRTADEEAEFRKLLPTEGFFPAYMQYTDRQESPDSYHFWVAATVIAGVLQRRAWINKGVYDIFPNLYTVLVGPSGVTRKSRAMRMGTDLIENYEWANVIADKTTPEALMEAMMFGAGNFERQEDRSIEISVDSSAFIRASELAVFLNKQSYTSGMVALLTDLFDSPKTFRYETRNKKPIHLQNVSVNFLGASTPEWLASNLPEAAFEGGFMSRMILVVRHMRNRFIAYPQDPEPGQTEALQKALSEIRKRFVGPVQLSPEASRWFEKWYISHETSARSDNYNLLGFIERKPDTVLKLAMIISASMNPDRKTIDIQHLKIAKDIITWTQQRMFRAFEHVELSHLGDLRRKLTTMMESNGGSINRREVMRSLGNKVRSVDDFREVESLMVETGELIIEHQRPKSGKGRSKVIYKIPTAQDIKEMDDGFE